MDDLIHLQFNEHKIELHRYIRIHADSTLSKQLGLKLDEYRERLLQPDLDAHRETSTNYKVWILQQLLDRNTLDFNDLKASVTPGSDHYTLSLAYLAYAWKVIENYTYALGENNRGGTGLPELPWTFGATAPLGSPMVAPGA
ncbi:MAG: hypothetical protein ABJA67_14840 [Chthonomonadales bacterium]